ncbi:hypothetical protein U9M48_012841 [Paspalum notatum var. saurae]|uniref:Uncharacterized protein n=1 Tax=Paspalum notatum var. saurae TaxID=547442 RepID=A0AAQ3SZB2_PASNO
MSSLIGKDNEDKSKQKQNIERLEMAHIKMEAVLQVSDRWHIADMSLLQWQRRLKRAAQECEDTLLSSKPLKRNRCGSSNDESGNSFADIKKFERYANGANEFLKTVRFGGTLWRYTFFDPVIGHLLSGKSMKYQASWEDKLLDLNLRPMSSAERGVQAIMGFSCQHFSDPKKGFYVPSMLRLSESTDIFGVIIKCVQAVAPHFKFAAESIRTGLIQLPTQDFSWDSPYSGSEFWANIHDTITQWHRPNPLCCSEHRQHPISFF